jgi:hypothetical protein
MSLEVGVGRVGVGRNHLEFQRRFALEDDGYYWFLYPLFEKLERLTTQLIDLYDSAVFSGARLDDLENTVEQARALVAGQPERWRVHVAMNDPPDHPEGLREVTRAGFNVLFEQFQNVIDEARATGSSVIFVGD